MTLSPNYAALLPTNVFSGIHTEAQLVDQSSTNPRIGSLVPGSWIKASPKLLNVNVLYVNVMYLSIQVPTQLPV